MRLQPSRPPMARGGLDASTVRPSRPQRHRITPRSKDAGRGGGPAATGPPHCLWAPHIPAPIIRATGWTKPRTRDRRSGGLGEILQAAPCPGSGPSAGPLRRWEEAWSEMSRPEGNRQPLTHPVEQWCAPCRIAVPRGPLHIARASPAHPPARRLSIAPRDGCEGRKDRSNGRIPGKRRGRTRARADISSSSPSQPPHGVRNTRGINGLSQRRGAIASPARPPHFSRPARYAAAGGRGEASCKERGG